MTAHLRCFCHRGVADTILLGDGSLTRLKTVAKIHRIDRETYKTEFFLSCFFTNKRPFQTVCDILRHLATLAHPRNNETIQRL